MSAGDRPYAKTERRGEEPMERRGRFLTFHFLGWPSLLHCGAYRSGGWSLSGWVAIIKRAPGISARRLIVMIAAFFHLANDIRKGESADKMGGNIPSFRSIAWQQCPPAISCFAGSLSPHCSKYGFCTFCILFPPLS